ncbi:MAG TPA: catalase family peroxidase [Polyangiaceae bacterium]|nr:catalase family peroxidase [Polyangiaceae bacterium]
MRELATRDTQVGTPARLALVIAIVLSVGGAFLYLGGWLSPQRLTPARLVDTFERVNGPHPGFRRNHAKGVGISGYFEANGAGTRWSKASVFRPGRIAVVGRFALAGGMPYAGDSAATVRSLALRFSLPNGEEWRTGMNNIPVFVVNTPQAFEEQLIAMAPDPATKKPNPERVAAFVAKHPEFVRAVAAIKAQAPTSGFEDSTYNSLNAFELSGDAGRLTKVRWAMVPVPAANSTSRDSAHEAGGAPGANFLFDSLIARVKMKPLHFRLVLTIGQAGDSTSDATVAWPESRERVDVGTLTIDRVEGEATGDARTINFDPLVLPNGLAGSDDPLLSARSAAYSQSFTRRVSEPVFASAVTTPENPAASKP